MPSYTINGSAKDSELTQRIAYWLAFYMRKNRWDLNDIVRETGLAKTTLVNIRKGHHYTRTDIIERMARGLGVDPLDLLQPEAVRVVQDA